MNHLKSLEDVFNKQKEDIIELNDIIKDYKEKKELLSCNNTNLLQEREEYLELNEELTDSNKQFIKEKDSLLKKINELKEDYEKLDKEHNNLKYLYLKINTENENYKQKIELIKKKDDAFLKGILKKNNKWWISDSIEMKYYKDVLKEIQNEL